MYIPLSLPCAFSFSLSPLSLQCAFFLPSSLLSLCPVYYLFLHVCHLDPQVLNGTPALLFTAHVDGMQAAAHSAAMVVRQGHRSVQTNSRATLEQRSPK